jgi:hypothetical protein
LSILPLVLVNLTDSAEFPIRAERWGATNEAGNFFKATWRSPTLNPFGRVGRMSLKASSQNCKKSQNPKKSLLHTAGDRH